MTTSAAKQIVHQSHDDGRRTQELGLPDNDRSLEHATSADERVAEAEQPPGDESICVARQVWTPTLACLAALTFLAVCHTLYFGRALLFPIALAFVLNLVFKPIVLALRKWHIPEPASACLILVGFSCIVGLGVFTLWAPARKWIDHAPGSLQQLTDKLQPVRKPLEDLEKASKQVNEMTNLPGSKPSLQVEEKPPSLASMVVNTTGGFFAGAMITVVLLLFLLAAGDRLLEKLVELMPTWADKRRMVSLAREAQAQISSYLFTITVINIGLGAVIGFGLWGMGLPNPVLWGVMAALLNYIPFVGLFAGAAIVFLVAMMVDSFDIWYALLAPAIYLGANAIEANFVTPALLGRSISLNPVVIILAIFFWGWLWGIGGVLLAVPLLVVTKIYCDHSEALAPIGNFLAE